MIVPHTIDFIFQQQLSISKSSVELCAKCLRNLMFKRFMLPLKFCKMCFDSHMVHRCFSSDAKAFRTFDWEIPNCRAIRDGVTPALNAARTAFNFPCARGTSAMSTFRRFLIGGDCSFVKLGRTSNRCRNVCKSVSTPSGVLPRRFISSRVAACRKSNSPSLKCLTALGRFLGRTCRCGAVSVAASVAVNFGGAEASRTVAVGEASRTIAGENRSRTSCLAGSRPVMGLIMPLTMSDGNQHAACFILAPASS